MTTDNEKSFLEWLDKQIEEMESKQKGWEASYDDIMDRGALHKLKIVREKFLTLTPPPTTLS